MGDILGDTYPNLPHWKSMLKPKLGRHLEWHGNRIRVVVRVPPTLVAKAGKTKLREVLATRDPLEAEREKVDVVRRLKAELRGELVAITQTPLIEEALRWREALGHAKVGQGENDQNTVINALDDRVDNLRAEHGHETAHAFAAVASGAATPLTTLLDRWFAEKKFSTGYEEDIRRAISRLEQWCRSAAVPATIEAIQRATAGRFIHELYIEPQVDVTTANKDISCLRSYWRWMNKRHHDKENPWSEQSVQERRSREATESGDKRPFTDQEVCKLLNGISHQREWEFSFFSALSGLRINEIGALRVKDCVDGKVAVTKSKTPSGVRTIPAHPLLEAIIKRRCKGKRLDEYLFHELPDQKVTSKRDRSAPVSQAFTRERRKLGIEEKASGEQRQSNIDFHSWRRWFIRQAVEALEKGAVGYSPWTIARVVGHKVEDGTIEGERLPLGMTMGRYPGAGSSEAMTACVKAVSMPKGAPTRRDDLQPSSPLTP